MALRLCLVFFRLGGELIVGSLCRLSDCVFRPVRRSDAASGCGLGAGLCCVCSVPPSANVLLESATGQSEVFLLQQCCYQHTALGKLKRQQQLFF